MYIDNNMTPIKPYLIKAFYDWILDNGYTPFIRVVESDEKVLAPKGFANEHGIITLNISRDATANFTFNKQGITFEARFSGVFCNLFIPFNAIVAIYAKENGEGSMFEYDPSEQLKIEEQGIEFLELDTVTLKALNKRSIFTIKELLLLSNRDLLKILNSENQLNSVVSKLKNYNLSLKQNKTSLKIVK